MRAFLPSLSWRYEPAYNQPFQGCKFSPRLARRAYWGGSDAQSTTHNSAGSIGYGVSAGCQQLRQTQLFGPVLPGCHEYQAALLADGEQRTDEGCRSIWRQGGVAWD